MYDIVNKAMCEIDKNTRNWIEKVYRQGYEDKREEECNCANQMQEIYEKGLNDAWDVVKKIYDMDGGDLVEVFNDYNPYNVTDKYTAAEAIAKIKKYEDKQNNKEKDIKDEMTISKMLDILEHVFTCPSELYDRDDAMSKIMEAYRELRKKDIKRDDE